MCALKVGARVNWILRKQQRLRACSDRASVNARARKHALRAFIVRLSINACAVHLLTFFANGEYKLD